MHDAHATGSTAGGNLIAMRPDPQLAGLLGLTDAGRHARRTPTCRSTPASGPGAGIVGQTIQFHGTADRYDARAAPQPIATLYSNATTATSNPAVTLRSVGVERRPGGGLHLRPRPLGRLHAPGQPGLGRPGARRRRAPIRSDDLFFGAAAGDPQPDWVDLDKVAIPQADEQQRLLANLIEQMNRDRKPLPRFWYFPRGEKAVVVMTGDDHAQRRHRRPLRPVLSAQPGRLLGRRLGVRARRPPTSIPNTPLTDAQAAAYDADGLRDRRCTSDDRLRELHAGVARPGLRRPARRVRAPSSRACPAPATNRTHCIAWSDWATQPKVELDHGIRLDTNYYYWPAGWVQDRPGMFTGSGHADALRRPRRLDDRRLPGGDPDDRRVRPVVSRSPSTRCSTTRSAPRATTAPSPPTCTPTAPASAGSDAIVASALARGVPVVSAARCSSGSTAATAPRSTASPGTATSSASRSTVGAGANGLRAMVPTSSAVGGPDRRDPRRHPGRDHHPDDQGRRVRVLRRRPPATTRRPTPSTTTAPAISNVAAHRRRATARATITWDTNEPSDSRVDYGTSPGVADLERVERRRSVTSHSVELDRPRAEHDLLLPGHLGRRRVQLDHRPGRCRPAAQLHAPRPPASPTPPSPTSPPASPGADTYVSETADGEVTLTPTVGAEFSGARPADRLVERDLGVAGRRCRRQRHGLGRQPARRRRLRRHRRDLRPRPLARVRRHLRRRPVPARRLQRQLQQRLGDLQHQRRHRPALRPHQHGLGRHRHPASRRADRLRAPLPDRVGRRPRSASTSTAPWSRPTRPPSARR